MKKLLVLALFISLPVVLFAQNNNMKSQKLPEGWMMRFDKTNAGAKDFNITKENNNYFFKTDPIGAAIYYNPENNQKRKFFSRSRFYTIKTIGPSRSVRYLYCRFKFAERKSILFVFSCEAGWKISY